MLDRAFYVNEATGAVALHVSWRGATKGIKGFFKRGGDRNYKVVAAA